MLGRRSPVGILVPKLFLFKNIVPFYQIGLIGRARQALIIGAE